ncbi:MAG: hypothetical protein AAF830_03460 [Pseudomonadota bacterium]
MVGYASHRLSTLSRSALCRFVAVALMVSAVATSGAEAHGEDDHDHECSHEFCLVCLTCSEGEGDGPDGLINPQSSPIQWPEPSEGFLSASPNAQAIQWAVHVPRGPPLFP